MAGGHLQLNMTATLPVHHQRRGVIIVTVIIINVFSVLLRGQVDCVILNAGTFRYSVLQEPGVLTRGYLGKLFFNAYPVVVQMPGELVDDERERK